MGVRERKERKTILLVGKLKISAPVDDWPLFRVLLYTSTGVVLFYFIIWDINRRLMWFDSHWTCHIVHCTLCLNHCLNLMTTCYLIYQSCTAPVRMLFMLMPALHWLSFDFALLVAWFGISHMPTHSFPCLSSGYVPFCCLFHAAPMLFPQCAKHQSLNQTITYQVLGCSILSLATGIPSLALAAACPAHNLKLSVCVAYGHRACFTSGTYSALHIHLLAAAYGPAHDHVCVAYGHAPASHPGLTRPYTYIFSWLLMVPHTTTSVLLMDPRLLYVQACTGPETPCPGILCPLLCYPASCSHPAPYKPNQVSVYCEGRC